jgi:hypothetical protein
MFHRRNRTSVAQTTQKHGMRRRVGAGMPPSKRGRAGGNSICTGDHLPIPRSGLFRSGQEHAPMRIADPFIMIIHVIGSLRFIHDFGPTPGCCFRLLRTLLASVELRDRRGGYLRPRKRSHPGSVAHAAGIDRHVVQATGVCRAPRNSTDRHISHCAGTSRPRKSSHGPKTCMSAARE